MTSESKFVWPLIVNPNAGAGRARRMAARAVRTLRRLNQPVEIWETRSPGQAVDLVEQATTRGAERLLVCGGDGTINQLLGPLSASPSAPALGILPGGTCNDLALALGIPRKSDAAVAAIVAGAPTTIDLGRVGNRLFATVAGCGFDAQVSQLARENRWPGGTTGYLFAALRTMRCFQPPRLKISGEFGSIVQEVLLVATGNTSTYGGGLRVTPEANPRDGKLDICIVGPVSNWTILIMLGRIFAGGHISHPAVRMERSTWISVEASAGEDGPFLLHGDGEDLAETPFTIAAQVAAIDVILPTPRA